MDYQEFLSRKHIRAAHCGFDVDPSTLPDALFDWQRAIVAWALKRGRTALFEDCGLGKTFQELAWAQAVTRHTGGKVLIVAPLAVGPQMVREGQRFGVEAKQSRTGDDVSCPITITNYEMIDHYSPDDFIGVVLDESSILKAFMGKTKRKLIDMWERTPYRLAATATPAPNDHTELGNHSEFLGLYSLQEMQSRWFVNDGFDAGCYRLKGHAERDFWEWCASWAVAIQNPADIGYNGSAYHLPELETIQHIVASDESAYEKGMLLDIEAISATGIHKELRKSVESRSAELADIVNATTDTWVVWCQTDYEADELVRRIPDAIEVRGSMPYDKKADLLDRFSLGQERVIITKPRIAGWGLCWHHCSHMATVSPTYSFESRYQTVRRLWRFGQVNKVEDHVFMTRREASIFDQANRKQTRHNTMADAIRKFGHELSVANRRELKVYNPEKQIVLPSFLKGA